MTDRESMPLSVVIPSGRELPKDLVESLRSQLEKRDEIIVVNDAPWQNRSWSFEESTTDWRRTATTRHTSPENSLERSSTQIQVQPSQGGASVARNVGWNTATNDWILFLDDDVIVDNEFLQSVRNSLEHHPNSDVVGFRVVSSATETSWQRIGEETLTLDRGPEQRTNEDSPIRIQNTWLYGAGAALAVNRSLLEAMNGFKPQLGAGRPYGGTEDTEFLWHASHHGTISYDGTVSVSHPLPRTFEGWRGKLVDYGQCVGHLAGLVDTQDATAYAAGFCYFIRDSIDTPAFSALPQHEHPRVQSSINAAVTETIRTLHLSREAFSISVGCSMDCKGGLR